MVACRRIKPGDTEVEVEDWETGEARLLPLDATQTPAQQSEALYRRCVWNVAPLQY